MSMFQFCLSFQVLQGNVRAGEEIVCDFLDVYACDICRDFGLPRPQSQHTRDQMPLDLVLTCFVVHCTHAMLHVTYPDLVHGQAKQFFREHVRFLGEGWRCWAGLPSAKALMGSLSVGLALLTPLRTISNTDMQEWFYATSRLSCRTPRHTKTTSASGIRWPTSSTKLGSLWQQLATSYGTSICSRRPT